MSKDLIHHYPPELVELLVNAIPRLLKSKQSVIDFFKGCGTPEPIYRDVQDTLRRDRDSINKFEIARTIIVRLNDRGDSMLAQRREVLKRVSEWDDFSTGYENQRMEARGHVSSIREMINVKDSFTRMNIERKQTEQERRAAKEAERREALRVAQEKQEVRDQLAALFAETNPQRRGVALEKVLNRLFAVHGILIRESFTRVGGSGEGVIEQIDGVIELDGEIYLVEMKWWSEALGPGQVSQHLVRVFNRNQARGILISQSGFTSAAIATVKESLGKVTFALVELSELVFLLEREESLVQFLKARIQSAVIDKEPAGTAFQAKRGGAT